VRATSPRLGEAPAYHLDRCLVGPGMAFGEVVREGALVRIGEDGPVYP
jgi:hypothetical protein